MFFIILNQTHPGHQKTVSSFSVRQWKWTPPSSWRQEERFSILFLTVPHLKRAFLLIICKRFITNSPFIRAMCYSPCPLALPLSFKLVCNLLLPPLFGFCLATAVGVVFWSAVRAPGTTGADGVLPCMNGETEEKSWIESHWMVSVQHLPLVAPRRHHRNMVWSATASLLSYEIRHRERVKWKEREREI